jgi:SulP family sulfate permease
MRNVPFIDATGMHNFKEVLKTLHHYKVEVVLSGVRPEVYDSLVKAGIEQYISLDQVCSDYDIARPKAIGILDGIGKVTKTGQRVQ